MGYTGKDRVLAAYRREYADRVPYFVGVGPHILNKLGISPVDYLTKPELTLKVAIAAQEEYPSDIVIVPGNPVLPETIAMMRILRGDTPVKHRLADKGELAKLHVPNPEQDRYVAPHLEMCDRAKNAFKDVVLETIVGGPWSVAMEMRGTEQTIYDTADDPQFVRDVMAFTTELAKVRCVAFAKMGIWPTIGEPSGSCSLISPKMFRQHVKPFHVDLVKRVKLEQDIPMTLHMCGHVDPIMEDLVEIGYDRIEIDSPSSLQKMVDVSKKKVVVRGNIAATLFSEGTREQMEAAVKACVSQAAQGGAFILAQGCTIPLNSPLENVQYFIDAAQKYGRYES